MEAEMEAEEARRREEEEADKQRQKAKKKAREEKMAKLTADRKAKVDAAAAAAATAAAKEAEEEAAAAAEEEDEEASDEEAAEEAVEEGVEEGEISNSDLEKLQGLGVEEWGSDDEADDQLSVLEAAGLGLEGLDGGEEQPAAAPPPRPAKAKSKSTSKSKKSKPTTGDRLQGRPRPGPEAGGEEGRSAWTGEADEDLRAEVALLRAATEAAVAALREAELFARGVRAEAVLSFGSPLPGAGDRTRSSLTASPIPLRPEGRGPEEAEVVGGGQAEQRFATEAGPMMDGLGQPVRERSQSPPPITKAVPPPLPSTAEPFEESVLLLRCAVEADQRAVETGDEGHMVMAALLFTRCRAAIQLALDSRLQPQSRAVLITKQQDVTNRLRALEEQAGMNARAVLPAALGAFVVLREVRAASTPPLPALTVPAALLATPATPSAEGQPLLTVANHLRSRSRDSSWILAGDTCGRGAPARARSTFQRFWRALRTVRVCVVYCTAMFTERTLVAQVAEEAGATVPAAAGEVLEFARRAVELAMLGVQTITALAAESSSVRQAVHRGRMLIVLARCNAAGTGRAAAATLPSEARAEAMAALEQSHAMELSSVNVLGSPTVRATVSAAASQVRSPPKHAPPPLPRPCSSLLVLYGVIKQTGCTDTVSAQSPSALEPRRGSSRPRPLATVGSGAAALRLSFANPTTPRRQSRRRVSTTTLRPPRPAP